jgi:8-oxo-dGTP diphosphatase
MSRLPDGALPVSTDVVVFTIRDGRLNVLLVPDRSAMSDLWRLPGGPPDRWEDLDAAAERHLREDTRLSGVFLEQLYTFGRPDRNPARRTISVSYFASLPVLGPIGADGDDGVSPRLFEVSGLPPLMLDHREIVSLAHRRLASKLEYSTIALQFMPERFPLSALQRVYEAILGTAMDKRNFRKRMLALACLEDTGEYERRGRHRPARLYRIKAPGRVEIFK